MILIADSGSTKTDWMLCPSEGDTIFTNTIGFNPFLHSVENIKEGILESQVLTQAIPEVDEVYFYGAGCSSDKLKAIVREALEGVFKEAKIEVYHDTMASVYSTYSGEPGISCILGTGSNSCYFDGKEAYEEVPALGYILGDEGSGSYFGKRLMRGFLYKSMPQDIADDFQKTYQLNKKEILVNVLSKPFANVYLASFGKFIDKHVDHPYFQEMLEEGFTKFLSIHVACFKNYKEVPVHFVGSISFYYQRELRATAKKMGIRVGNIIHKPIEGLVAYHMKQKQKAN